MKTYVWGILVVAMSVLANVGCATKSSDSGLPSATPSASASPYVVIPNGGYVPPTDGPGHGPGSNFQFGGTATFTPVSTGVFSQYTGRPMNNPQNMEINLNLIQYGPGNYYGGDVTIAYDDNGNHYSGHFTGGNSQTESRYNVITQFSGTTAFHGFFEDYMGAIIVVVNPTSLPTLGDGSTGTASGSVYFKNFGLTYAPHPPTYCWFVSLGPYDCRSWISGNGVNTFQTLYPNNGYVTLGTFAGLSIGNAFNGTADF